MTAPNDSFVTNSSTTVLDSIKNPADLRRINAQHLQQVANELRAETINAVAVTGGHLGASLGVIELTVALHYVFDTPNDKLIWDVGHQAYPHKILTGRRDRIRTLRTVSMIGKSTNDPTKNAPRPGKLPPLVPPPAWSASE